MARARLHIICGNCGCNDEFIFKIDPEGLDINDEETKFKPAVFITCNNCGTLHSLDDTVPEYKLFDNVKRYLKTCGLRWSIEHLKKEYLRWMDSVYVSKTPKSIFEKYSSEFAEFFRTNNPLDYWDGEN